MLKISLFTCLLLASMSRGQNGKLYSKYRVRLNNEHTPMTKMVLFEEIKFPISVIVGGNWSAPNVQGQFHSVIAIFNIGEFVQCSFLFQISPIYNYGLPSDLEWPKPRPTLGKSQEFCLQMRFSGV